jgi:hypothetical protein
MNCNTCKVKVTRYQHADNKGEREYSPTHSSPQHYIGVSGQCHALAVLYPWERTTSTHWIGGWEGLRAGLDIEAKGKILCLCQGSKPGHLVAQSIDRHYTD